MKVVVSLEHRFDRTPDGSVWDPGVFSYAFWQRYLEVFDHVRVVARLGDVTGVPPQYRESSGKGVTFEEVPYYIGPWQYLRVWDRIVRVARRVVSEDGAVIMRIPSPIASTIWPVLREMKKPYGLEVVGDPHEVFTVVKVGYPFHLFFRWLFSRQMRRQCALAFAAAYVTRETLQRRYPCVGYSLSLSDVELPPHAFMTTHSSVESTRGACVRTPRTDLQAGRVNLVSIGSLEQMYKGPDVLIDAVHHLVREGLDVRLVWVGDGKNRRHLEARCLNKGLGGRISFRGYLPAGDAVRAELDKADVFVMASRTEGLPRAMIEAMARGLPCIGTNVGGIPELLAFEDLVPAGNAEALARKIREVLVGPARLVTMSNRNLKTAGEYRADILHERRKAFYRNVREKTEAWLTAKTVVRPVLRSWRGP